MAQKSQKKPKKKGDSHVAKVRAAKERAAKRSAPRVAVYGVEKESERGALLRRVVRELDFDLREVHAEQLSDPVGSIAGLVGYHPAFVPFDGETPEGEFLLLCNLNKHQLDDFLMALKIVGVSIPHKAVLTKENRGWSFIELMVQVVQEHEQLAAARAEQEASAEEFADDGEAADKSTGGVAADPSSKSADENEEIRETE